MEEIQLKEKLKTFEGFRNVFVENLSRSLSIQEAYERTESLYLRYFHEKPYQDHMAFFSAILHRGKGKAKR